jgi:hypothetical protein
LVASTTLTLPEVLSETSILGAGVGVGVGPPPNVLFPLEHPLPMVTTAKQRNAMKAFTVQRIWLVMAHMISL